MGIAFVQQGANHQGSGTGVGLGGSMSLGAGNAGIIISAINGTTAASCSGGGVTWSKIASIVNGAIECSVWVGYGASGGVSGIGVNYSGTGAGAMNCSEWSGLSGVTDVTGTGADTGTSVTASLTTTNAVDLILLGAAWNYSGVESSHTGGWTGLTQDGAGGIEVDGIYQIQSSTGTFSPVITIGSSGVWAAVIVALEGTPPAAGVIRVGMSGGMQQLTGGIIG